MRIAIALGLVLAAASCGDNIHPGAIDGPPPPDGPMVDAPAASDLTEFVHQQILGNTLDDVDPVAYPVFASLPDPDRDDTDYSAYADLFP